MSVLLLDFLPSFRPVMQIEGHVSVYVLIQTIRPVFSCWFGTLKSDVIKKIASFLQCQLQSGLVQPKLINAGEIQQNASLGILKFNLSKC